MGTKTIDKDPVIKGDFIVEIDGVPLDFNDLDLIPNRDKIYTAYKLTNQNMQTYQGFQWKLGEWKQVSGRGFLCTEGWLHCYSDPLLGLIMNPAHADIEKPRLFQVSVKGKHKTDFGLKEGYEYMKLDKELKVFRITKKILININKNLYRLINKGSYKYPIPIHIKMLLSHMKQTLSYNIACILVPPPYLSKLSTSSDLARIVQILHSVIEGENQ